MYPDDRASRLRTLLSGVALGAGPLLDQIYRGLLGRPVDSGGRRTYLPRVQRREYAEVLTAIIDSREFRSRLPR
jgi:hypothetical protein